MSTVEVSGSVSPTGSIDVVVRECQFPGYRVDVPGFPVLPVRCLDPVVEQVNTPGRFGYTTAVLSPWLCARHAALFIADVRRFAR